MDMILFVVAITNIEWHKQSLTVCARPSQLIELDFQTCFLFMNCHRRKPTMGMKSFKFWWPLLVCVITLSPPSSKQHWQLQCVPGLSTAAESNVDSEMLILFVYFPRSCTFSLKISVWKYLWLKHNVFQFGKEIKSHFQSPLENTKFI